MLVFQPPAPTTGEIATAAVAGVAAALCGLVPMGLPWPQAVGLVALTGVITLARQGPLPALVAVTPGLALAQELLVASSGWPLACALGLAAYAGAVARLRGRELAVSSELRPLRHELRDAEHERDLLERHLARYPGLLDACLELSASREYGAFASALCKRARELVPESDEVLVFLGDGKGLSALAGLDRRNQAVTRQAGDEERYVAAEARTLLRRHDGVVTLLAPLRSDRRSSTMPELPGAGDGMRGVLAVRLRVGTVGDRLHLDLLQALARLGGLGLAAVGLLEQARALALNDELTGLYGRHEFLRRLDEQVALARRLGLILAVVMCDMDHLKKYNDGFGHPAGDAALRVIGKTLMETVAPYGIAARFGGEEFAALLTVASAEVAQAAAELIRAAIADATPDHQNPERRVTASLGVAVLRAGEDGVAALGRADAAMYEAKRAGRNRVVMSKVEAQVMVDGVGAAP